MPNAAYLGVMHSNGKQMRLLLIIIVVLALAGCQTVANKSGSEDLGYKGYKTAGSAVPKAAEELEQLKSRPDARFREQQGWTIVTVDNPEERAIWSFTPKSHPAYPSVVKREVVEEGGEIRVRTTVICRSTKPVCDQLVRDFIALNENVRKSVGE